MPISLALSASVRLSCKIPAIAPVRVTCRPSTIQVTPSPITTSQCHLLHGKRSRRCGTFVSIQVNLGVESVNESHLVVRVYGLGALPAFHLILHPVLGFCSSEIGFPARAESIAALKSLPVTGLS